MSVDIFCAYEIAQIDVYINGKSKKMKKTTKNSWEIQGIIQQNSKSN